MPITLPYVFDTRRDTRAVVQLVLALLAVMVFAGVYMLAIRGDVVGAAGTLVIDAMLVAFGVVLLRFQPGAEGRITRDAVETRASRVWGVPMPGPVGTFPIDRFRAVCVERVLNSGNRTTSLHEVERVTLAGKPGTPDVRVVSQRIDGGDSLGEALAAARGLPGEITRTPRKL